MLIIRAFTVLDSVCVHAQESYWDEERQATIEESLGMYRATALAELGELESELRAAWEASMFWEQIARDEASGDSHREISAT